MNLKQIQKLQEILPEINKQYHRQVYVHDSKDGKTVLGFSEQHDIPYINLNIEFSRLLKGIPQTRRLYKVTDFFNKTINSYTENTICIDYYELLFDPSLSVNPFDLFKNASRNKTLVIALRGKLTEQEFIHAEPVHPEYTKFPIHGTLVIK
ncbi:BREX-3 system P-loop-containing protein BrxF [Sporosarcina highlanderae]|uniref:BREX-3 system P-loop-containing protein BrxF n=1 Tax=Sporosarcina highlanderae TaxID=3035916 RepID=A0ABT8JSQ1_9BACL|nr:BREX-3 system P-loop-containing protein BrxF [Sporosarcina highlanderae]MDN4608199.1 BREX-3 system P-loop-containing protein BrxF [Sporosarcina highlanderae]